MRRTGAVSCYWCRNWLNWAIWKTRQNIKHHPPLLAPLNWKKEISDSELWLDPFAKDVSCKFPLFHGLLVWRISCISHLESGWLNQTFQNSTTSSVLFEPKLSSLRDDLCTWFFQLVLWKTCFYLQNECRARSSSFEILAFLMYHPGIFLSWLDRNLLSLEAKSDISIQCNKNIFWYLKFMDHPWLTRGTMDKTSPKSSFSVKQCQPLAALPFGLNWMGFTRDCRRILGQD